LRVEVGALKPSEMLEVGAAESSEKIRERVMKALRLQEERYSAIGIPHNSRLSPDMIKKFCPLDNDCERLLRLGMESKGYSGRAIHRMIRVARTIADLDGSEEIKLPHLAESIQFHSIERLDEL